MVNVTQADRDLAADIVEGFFMSRRIRAGAADNHKVVQLIAAHRIATIEECAKVAAVWSPDAEYDIMALKGPTNDQA